MAYNVPGDRSNFFPLTGSLNNEYKVFLIILKAVIPIGVARNTGFPFPASIAIS
jgi:hypothetical protein